MYSIDTYRKENKQALTVMTIQVKNHRVNEMLKQNHRFKLPCATPNSNTQRFKTQTYIICHSCEGGSSSLKIVHIRLSWKVILIHIMAKYTILYHLY